MSRTNWTVGVVLWTLAIGPGSASGQDGGPSSLRVLLNNHAEVQAEIVERAQEDVSALFRRSNIPFTWIAADECGGSCLIIRILSKPIGGKSRNRRVLGIAPGSRELRGKLAFVFYERIRTYSAELGLEASQMLGHVMAHELGHLLLPYGAHSVAGIMRPEWDRAQVSSAAAGTLRFTPSQADLIRTHLQASASPIARAR